MTAQVNEKQKFCLKKTGKEEGTSLLFFLAPGIEHGIFGGPEAEQVSHLVAELGEVLPQVVQVLYRSLVCALHLLSRGGQIAVNQAAHDLLVVLIALLLQIFPLLPRRNGRLFGNMRKCPTKDR